MKLVTLECPYCSAQLEINSEIKQAQCNYCGKTFIIENELENSYQSGYEFEQGRQAAKNDSIEDLAEKVGSLIRPMQIQKKLVADEKRLKSEIKDLQKKQQMASTSFGIISPYIIAGVIVLLGIALAVSTKSWILFFMGLVGAVVYYFSSISMRKNTAKTLPDKLEKYNKVCSQLKDIEENYDFSIIPPDYRTDEKMNYIYKALSNQRALSIHDAINLYEEEKYREEMKKLQREQIEAQKKQTKEMKRLHNEQLALQREQMEMEESKRGLTMDGVLAAGSVVAAGITIAKALRRK